MLSLVHPELVEGSPLQAQAPCGRQSLPLRKEVSARGSVNSATGWIK